MARPAVLTGKDSADSRLTYAVTYIERAKYKRVMLDMGIAALGDKGLALPPRLRMEAAENLMQWGEPDGKDRTILIKAWGTACLDWAAEGKASRKTVTSKRNQPAKANGDPVTASPPAEAAAAVGWKPMSDNAVQVAKKAARKLLPNRFAARLGQPSDTM